MEISEKVKDKLLKKLKLPPMSEKKRNIIDKSILISLLVFMFITVLVTVFSPLVTVGKNSLTPADLIGSWDISIVSFGLKTLDVSYYVAKVFYILLAVTTGALFVLALYFVVVNKKRLHTYIFNIMTVLTVFLFISMLLGFNYKNLYEVNEPAKSTNASGTASFVIALILLALKYAAGIVFGKKEMPDNLKESGTSITTAFVLLVFVLSILFTPLYTFPGTPYRVFGFQVLFGGADPLSFLPMSGAYRAFIAIFVVFALISFAVNLLLYFFKPKAFVHYNKINISFGLTALIVYALMGVNYMIVYLDAAYFVVFPAYSMNTFSYLPLALFVMYRIGILFSKITTAKINVEYKLSAKAEDGTQPEQEKKSAKEDRQEKTEDTVPDPIPAFSELDRRIPKYAEELKKRKRHTFEDLTLPKLVTHIIDYARYSEERLSYGPAEIKTFLAGISASRLSILQGMSGTGKTSLPKIFMEAIDGYCELVAVESSWRDKNELLGYYNEFTKKYTPKSFTQFLYEASLNREVPCFIVLDEMNLSRIEYYFSDFLSLMESRENARRIKLFDVQLYPHIDERKNYLALRDGHTVDIPPNVWFVGTANRDESTFEISDKVYDRAQTMNFDRRAPKAVVNSQTEYPQKFVPYAELRALFAQAKSAMEFDAENFELIQKVEKLLRPYKISFGNRILKQMEDFVKTFVACSEIQNSAARAECINEAVDYIIFSKIVRKLEFKQLADIDSLIDEFTKLKLPKCTEFLQSLTETT